MGSSASLRSGAPTVIALLNRCVLIRNKTKAHGAFGPDFWIKVNQPYLCLTRQLLLNSPLCGMQFAYVKALENTTRIWRLLGLSPEEMDVDEINMVGSAEGTYVIPLSGSPIYLRLQLANVELSRFYLPNGGWRDKRRAAEFIDYASGDTIQQDCPEFGRPPAALPKSTTHGHDLIDVYSNVWGNLPKKSDGYVRRRVLEEALMRRICDRNHAIITLHGIGGIGKTSLGLWAAYDLANQTSPPFDKVLWFSARDLDLRQSGPSPVKPAVATLEDVAQAHHRLLDTGKTIEDFAKALQEERDGPTLFVFDNFETFSEPRALHEFLDLHTILPNKVLITSRERAFKADYSIEVKGLEWPEAEVVILQTARRFHAEGKIDLKTRERLWKESEGHPYLMQMLVGEIASVGKYESPPAIMGRREDVIDAIFERSFTKLSSDGRWCFLVVANWRASVPYVYLCAVGLDRLQDLEGGIEQCLRLSLISEIESVDGQACFEAPHVARIFAKRKLLGDPDRIAIQRDLGMIREFGVVQRAGDTSVEEVLRRFCQKVTASAEAPDEEHLQHIDRRLVRIAGQWPEAWRHLATFRSNARMSHEKIDEALRRSVEATPNDVNAWKLRAEFAKRWGDQETEMACMISAVEASPSDIVLVGDVANQLNHYVGSMLLERRQYYLASVRERMEQLAPKLDATGRSRLAWLYLHEENTQKAREHVKAGLKLDKDNFHCFRLWEKLEGMQT